jgi:hypothetical protein
LLLFDYFYLGEGPPVHVGAAEVDVFPVDDPELGVEDAAPEQLGEIETPHLRRLPLDQHFGVYVGVVLRGGVLRYLDGDLAVGAGLQQRLENYLALEIHRGGLGRFYCSNGLTLTDDGSG